jgi:hypothetical protein
VQTAGAKLVDRGEQLRAIGSEINGIAVVAVKMTDARSPGPS